jgi:hypothetical protein
VESRAVGVAGFSVNDCLDLALEILSSNVEEGDKALLTVVNDLVQAGDFDLALLDLRIRSSKFVLAFSDGIVDGLVDLWCQNCRRDCAGRPFCNGFLSFNDVVDCVFSDVSNFFFCFKRCVFYERVGKLFHVAAFLVHGETVFVKGCINASPIFVRVVAERLPVVVGLCFLDTIKVPKIFFLECCEAMSFGFFKHGVKGSFVVLFRFDHVAMVFDPDLLFGPDLLFQLLNLF